MRIFDSIKRKLGYNIKNNNGFNEEYFLKKLKKKYFKKNGKLHGEYYEYYSYSDDYWVQLQSVYREGKKNGLTKYFWKKHISAEGVFNDGKETGVIKKYFRVDDKFKNIISRQVINELADLDKGVYEVYSLNGKILERSKIDGVKFNGGIGYDGYWGDISPKRSGLSEKWFGNGKLKETGFWEKNNTSYPYVALSYRIGKHTQFHENGNIFKEGDWIDKYPADTHKFFYPNGNIEFEVEFVAGGIGSIIRERWYSENGALMNSDEIIKKGGIDQSKIPNPRVKVNLRFNRLIQKSLIIINEIKFTRMGEVDFYYNYKTSYNIGHSYIEAVKLLNKDELNDSNDDNDHLEWDDSWN
jgi:antitoxin component YwqK of YwqJK toxin-antitoxin module